MVDGLCAMANIVPVTAQVIGAAVFQSGHSYRVWTEMNSLVGHAVDETLPPLPVFDVSVARFRPGGSGQARREWVSSIKLKYRNARRLMLAQAMAQYIAALEENTHATRAKHYLFWMIVGQVRNTK
jgi:hypothetical protein